MRGYVTLPIVLVLAAVVYIYFTTVFVVIDGWLGLSTAAGLANVAVLTVLALMALATYGMAVLKDPGRVPSAFAPDIEDDETAIHEVKRKVLLIASACYELQKDQRQNGESFNKSYILCAALLCPLTVALSILLVWHIYLILHNKTTIEYHEGVRAMLLAEKVGNVYRHPYDIGLFENLVSVLGPNVFCWFCPVSKHIGSGLRFRTAFDIPVPRPSA